jgi:multidrug transporter EmrE-like cation transporter
MQRPTGVTAIAILFFLSAAYLAGLGAVMLVAPGSVSMMLGSPLLFGLELAGPYMFLLTALVEFVVAWGLLRLNNFARRAATIVAVLGVAMLVPSVSASMVSLSVKGLIWGGLGVIVRVMIAWYLWQRPVMDVFEKT